MPDAVMLEVFQFMLAVEESRVADATTFVIEC